MAKKPKKGPDFTKRELALIHMAAKVEHIIVRKGGRVPIREALSWVDDAVLSFEDIKGLIRELTEYEEDDSENDEPQVRSTSWQDDDEDDEEDDDDDSGDPKVGEIWSFDDQCDVKNRSTICKIVIGNNGGGVYKVVSCSLKTHKPIPNSRRFQLYRGQFRQLIKEAE